MKITDIKIQRVDTKEKLKAHVTVTFEDCFTVHNLKLIQGKDGLFMVMPRRKTKQGVYKDAVHPANNEFRSLLQEQILHTYAQLVNQYKEND